MSRKQGLNDEATRTILSRINNGEIQGSLALRDHLFSEFQVADDPCSQRMFDAALARGRGDDRVVLGWFRDLLEIVRG